MSQQGSASSCVITSYSIHYTKLYDDQWQVVPLADFIVVEVVRWRDFHAPGTELGVDIVICDHRDFPVA